MSILFIYEDYYNGKVLLEDFLPFKPFSPIFVGEYQEKFKEYIDSMIDKALDGELASKTDALLALAIFLEKKWPIPESLAKYVADRLKEAVIAFGHTDGRVEKRNNAVCKALGLTISKCKGQNQFQIFKNDAIHSYIWWRINLYDETLYSAAKKALKSFKGTRNINKHDGIEKIFKAVEDRRKMGHGTQSSPSLDIFLFMKAYPDQFPWKGIVFQDDDFLRDIAPQIIQIARPENEIFLTSLGLPLK